MSPDPALALRIVTDDPLVGVPTAVAVALLAGLPLPEWEADWPDPNAAYHWYWRHIDALEEEQARMRERLRVRA